MISFYILWSKCVLYVCVSMYLIAWRFRARRCGLRASVHFERNQVVEELDLRRKQTCFNTFLHMYVYVRVCVCVVHTFTHLFVWNHSVFTAVNHLLLLLPIKLTILPLADNSCLPLLLFSLLLLSITKSSALSSCAAWDLLSFRLPLFCYCFCFVLLNNVLNTRC